MDSMLQAVLQASIVSKCVLVLLLFMSVASWAYMAAKWLTLRAARRRTRQGLCAFDDAGALAFALPLVESDKRSPLYGITCRAVREFNRITRTGDAERLLNDNVRRALHFGIAEEMAHLKSSLALLATAANTAPFIGLFGTVWGIMHSFHSIGMLKSASLATVAPGISEALVATAIGLGVAVPATIGFNIFMGKLSQVDTLLVNFAGVFLNRVQRELNAHRPVQRTGTTEM